MEEIDNKLQKEKELEALIEIFGAQDAEFKKKKKELEDVKTKIKDLMSELELSDISSTNYKANYIVQHKQNVDEDGMLGILEEDWLSKNHSLQDCAYIKTKNYVDMDVLENYLYNKEIDDKVVEELNKCITNTEVIVLKVAKLK